MTFASLDGVQGAADTQKTESESPDILFHCEQCKAALIVDQSAAGMTLTCQQCGKPTTVPPRSVNLGPAMDGRRAVLERQLKENESQRTEVNGYINQLGIQLHRWKLRLQTLHQRQQQLADEMAGPGETSHSNES